MVEQREVIAMPVPLCSVIQEGQFREARLLVCLKKKKKNGYIQKKINRIPRFISSLPRFQKLLFKAAKINIINKSKGFRKNYLLSWSAKSEECYKEYTAHQIAEIGKNLLASLNAARRQR
jgi:hypothetical protein